MKSTTKAVLAFVPAVLLPALFGVSCQGGRDVVQPGSTPPGAMTYTGYDDAGQPLVTGWIRLDFVTIQTAPTPPPDGAWRLRALVDPSTVGPQVGEGTLTLSFFEDRVGADLNPGVADNNVTLLGHLTAGGPQRMRYEGRWTWSTIAGVRNSGPFLAAQP